MGKDIYRFALRLSTKNAEQVKVIEILEQIPRGRRNAAVCEMILQHSQQKDMEAIITAAVQKALGKMEQKPIETEEVSENILGFLNSLQKEGG